MSTAKRAYDLLRGYVNREYDRIRGQDLLAAERELEETIPPNRSPVASPTPSEIAQNRDESREDRARRILGVRHDADFEQVRKAFERLNKRSEASNFPLGSVEREQAVQIQRHVQWAYGVLSEGIDVVEKRFRSLEID